MRPHHLRVGIELQVRLSAQRQRGRRRRAGYHEPVSRQSCLYNKYLFVKNRLLIVIIAKASS